MRPSDVRLLWANVDKFKHATNWEPTIPFEKTMADLLEYWRDLLLVITGVRMEAIEAEPSLEEHMRAHAARLTARQATDVIRSLTSHEPGARYNLPTSLPFELGYVSASLALQGGGPPGRDSQLDVLPSASASARCPALRAECARCRCSLRANFPTAGRLRSGVIRHLA